MYGAVAGIGTLEITPLIPAGRSTTVPPSSSLKKCGGFLCLREGQKHRTLPPSVYRPRKLNCVNNYIVTFVFLLNGDSGYKVTF